MEKSDVGPKLQQLENFLLKPESEESKNYISALLEGKFGRPEDAFVHEFLSKDFWKELGYAGDEAIIERVAGIKGRVELSLDFDGKKIGVECKRPYNVKNEKEVINELKGDDINELEDQLGQYLTTHDFIIYTNGFHWFFYSQESHRAWLANKNKKDNTLKPYFKYLTANEIFSKKSSDYILNILGRNVILETLRAMEYKSMRHILTDSFFSDLKTWIGYIDTALSHILGTKKARTTSLINKLIFLRTMEAVGVIPIDFLAKNWEAKKGIGKSILNFIDQIDDDFSEIYDTELFTSKYLEDDNGNIIEEKGVPVDNPARNKNYVYKDLPEEFFSAILKRSDGSNLKDTGLTKLSLNGKNFYVKSLYWWKFEKISADILGKAYETYLARERKKLGIYYTPHQMTKFLASKTVSMVFDEKISKIKSELNKEIWDKEKLNLLGKEFSEITICDPSCGSGSFLIQAMRVIWSKYKELVKIIQEKDDQFAKAKPTLDDYSTDKVAVLRYFQGLLKIDDKQQRMGNIILRHIFGNDKDEKAIDTAKLNIWLECLRLDPNTYRRESLRGKRHVLPNLELNLTVGDSLVGLSPLDADKELSHMKDTIKSIFSLREKYTESFDKTSITIAAIPLRNALQGFANHAFAKKYGIEKITNLLKILEPTHWSLQHLFAFYDNNGNLRDSSEWGFDVIIGNPPWEVLKPNVDEFFSPIYNSTHEERFRTLTKDKKNEFVEKQLKNSQIKNQWDYYQNEIGLYADHLNSIEDYHYQQAIIDGKKKRGDNNLYKFFLEKSYSLLKKNGICGIIIPANMYSDLGTKGLRELVFYDCEIVSLYQFDNTKGIFDNIDSRTKFIILVFNKGTKTKKFKAAFFQNDVEKLSNLDNTSLLYDIDLVEKASPIALSLIECGIQMEVDIIQKLFRNKILLEHPEYHIKFVQADFHTTKDAHLYNTKGNGPILFQGGMIHQYTHRFSEPKYWIDKNKAVIKLREKESTRFKKNYKLDTKKVEKLPLDFEHYRIVWRNIARGTDARTMIATILTPNSFTAHSLSYIVPTFYNGKKFVPSIPNKQLIFLCGLLNSFVLDFILRHKVDKNVSMFFVYELPIVSSNESDFYFNQIINRVTSLICTTSEYESLSNEIGITQKLLEPKEREKAMAEINAYIAKMYGLTKSEFSYLLKNFRIINEDFKQETLNIFDTLKN